jgi:hypothetical protein
MPFAFAVKDRAECWLCLRGLNWLGLYEACLHDGVAAWLGRDAGRLQQMQWPFLGNARLP